MMTMFDWMFGGGTHSRLDVMNSKMDALIEGQKEIVATLNEGLKETNDNLKEISSILKGGLKETNDILQEILKKIEIRYPNGAAPVWRRVWPMACVICHSSCGSGAASADFC